MPPSRSEAYTASHGGPATSLPAAEVVGASQEKSRRACQKWDGEEAGFLADHWPDNDCRPDLMLKGDL